MSVHGWTNERLAAAAGVDPKTVDRWINRGRVPHRNTALRAAAALGTDPQKLWPALGRPVTRTGHPEVLAVHARRVDAPIALWWELFCGARRELDLLCHAGLFLHEQHPDLLDLLRCRAAEGCRVRIALSDPERNGETGALDADHEPSDLAARCRLSLRRFGPLLSIPGAELRVHHTTLFSGIYRADDEMLVNVHLWGVPGAGSPLWQLRRLEGARLFDTYRDSFEKVWALSDRSPAAGTP
ncbi:MAG: hypothetical protein QG608_273 [Actinomycetota bacterium]|nr:hypothetical protein [Actinomycetota bacterium]